MRQIGHWKKIFRFYLEMARRKKTGLDKAIKDIERGNAWDESDEMVQVEMKKPLDKVIPVRLSADKWEEMRREARELGVGPTTLARM